MLKKTILFCLLISCTSHDVAEQALQNPNCAGTDTWGLQLASTISITVPDDAHFWPSVKDLYRDTFLIANSQNDPLSLHVYDMVKQRHWGVVRLDPNFMQDPAALYVHNWDSIYVLGHIPMKLMLTDTTGAMKAEWDMRGAPTHAETPHDVDSYLFFPTTQPALHFSKDLSAVYVTLSGIDHWFFRSKQDIKLFGKYSLQKRAWEMTYGTPKGIYLTEKEVAYPFYLSHPQQLIIGDTAIASFPFDHQLYFYNIHTGEYLGNVCGSSDFIGDLPKPYSYKEAENNPQVSKDFLAGVGHYGKLQYHSKAKLVSRYVLHPQSTYSADGLLNSQAKRVSSLVFFDLEWNKVGEYVFAEESPFSGGGGCFHGYTSGIATSDGFFVSRRKELIQDEDTLAITAKMVFVKNE